MTALTYCLVLTIITTHALAASVSDIRARIIPNRVIISACILTLLALALTGPEFLLPHLMLAFLLSGCFLLPALISPGSIGMGDVKLVFVIAFALGQMAGIVIMVGLFAAACYALTLKLVKWSVPLAQLTLPLAPFLTVGLIGTVALAQAI